MIDLLTDQGQCVGALALIKGEINIIWAQRTILASGGAGSFFANPPTPIATADGHAMAYRAGAALQDMEMVQFHPTTLYVAGASRALITEAVRGEGAYLVDRNGYRFMKDYHPVAELAPRDIVSRAIVQQIRKTNFTHVSWMCGIFRPKPFTAVSAVGQASGSIRHRSGQSDSDPAGRRIT